MPKSRWRRARDATPFRGKRELATSVLAGVIVAVSYFAFVSGGAGVAALVGLGGAVLAAILVYTAELYWNWLQADKRLLMGHVGAIRDRLDALPSAQQEASPAYVPPRPRDLRTALLDAIRRGKELPNNGVSENAVEHWTFGVVDLLTHYGTPEEAEQFITAEPYLRGRLEALEQIAEARRGT